jgi:hypothetical protein
MLRVRVGRVLERSAGPLRLTRSAVSLGPTSRRCLSPKLCFVKIQKAESHRAFLANGTAVPSPPYSAPLYWALRVSVPDATMSSPSKTPNHSQPRFSPERVNVMAPFGQRPP